MGNGDALASLALPGRLRPIGTDLLLSCISFDGLGDGSVPSACEELVLFVRQEPVDLSRMVVR